MYTNILLIFNDAIITVVDYNVLFFFQPHVESTKEALGLNLYSK